MRSRCTSPAPSVLLASLRTVRVPGGGTGLDLRRGAAEALPTGSTFAPSPRPCTGGIVMGKADFSRRTVIVAPVLLAAIAGSGKAGGLDIGPLGVAHAAPPDPLETFVL